MTAQQLKNSILQMAMQGKLVPQDPNDEPASVLLERIRAEKEQMIKDGKIKKEKNPSIIFRGDDNLPYEKVGNSEPICIADEVPFEIPDSWEWVRLKTISTLNPRNNADDDSDAAFIPMDRLKDGYRNEYSYETKKWVSIKTGFTHFAKGDIIIAKITPCFQNRKSAVIQTIPNGIGAGTTELHVVRRITSEISNEYLLWIFKSAYFIDGGVKVFNGTAGQQRVGKEYLSNLLIPLPPKKEQIRISRKIDESMPALNKYSDKELELQSINKIFPKQLQVSILQQAVQGKLVPQDPTDEPASVLLERIRTEKEQLIKDGKIKRDKHESAIYRKDDSYYEKVDGVERCIDDEIPFEIPESWEWARLGSLSSVLGGKRIPAGRKLSQDNTGHIYIRVSDMKDGSVRTDSLLYVPLDIYPAISKYIINKEDIYITVAGTIGAVGKIPPELDGANLTENADRIVFSKIDQDWFICYLSSPYIQSEILRATTQVGQPKLAIKRIEKLLVALPPLKEQKNIVKEIKSLITLTNCL